MTKTPVPLGTLRHVLCAALLCASPLVAQAPDAVLTRGRVVRISWATQGLVSQMARVDRLSGDTLFVKAKFGDRTRSVTEVLRIPLREVDAVEYADQSPRRIPRAVKGMIIGGVLFGGSAANEFPKEMIVPAAAVGAIMGGAIGILFSREPTEDSYTWLPYCTKPCRP